MNKQEMFDRAVGGLIKQGKCCYDAQLGCLYNLNDGENTYKCVVGQLLTPEQAKEVEGTLIEFWSSYMLTEVFGSDYRELQRLGSRLQIIHDDNYNSPFWVVVEQFKELAEKERLEWKFEAELEQLHKVEV